MICPRCGTRQSANKKSAGSVLGLVAIIVAAFCIGLIGIIKLNNGRELNKVVLSDEKQIDSVNRIIDKYNKDNPNSVMKHISKNDFDNSKINIDENDDVTNAKIELTYYETKKKI